jgi:hypothetical protein
MPANPWCPSRRRERLPSGDGPPCSWHHQSDEGLVVVWPPEYRQWARENGVLVEPRHAAAMAAAHPRLQPAKATPVRAALEIVSPPSGATYLIDPTLRREFQSLPLRVVAATPGTIEWQVAGRVVGTSSSEAALMWPLTPGTHRITARDERGSVVESTVTVR